MPSDVTVNDIVSMNSRNGYLARTQCPCCGASSADHEIATASNPAAETMALSEHGAFLSGFNAQRVFFSYARCSQCGGLYCPVYYDEAQLKALYGRQAENMGDVPLQARERSQQGYARKLVPFVPAGGDYLEIGADIGLLAEQMSVERAFGRYWLYEPNILVHHELEARLSAQKSKIYDTMSLQDDASRGKVAAATLVHVLDHLIDPYRFLVELRGYLAPKGVVMTVTHNSSSTLASVLGYRWPPYTLQHPQLYSPASIKALFNRAGFNLLKLAPAVNHFPLGFLVRAGAQSFGIGSLVPNFRGPLVPIALGNMLVVAEAAGT